MKPVLKDPKTGAVLDSVDIADSESGTHLGTLDSASALKGLRCGNLTLDTDLYELTMVAGYGVLGKTGEKGCFDLYYRTNPDDGAFCISAGLESVINYVNNLGFHPEDIDYLKSLGIFSKAAIDYLSSGLKFTGDIWAVPEGTVVFPHEPLIRVSGPIPEAQILETTLLALVGHQTLIATKGARMFIATGGAPVMDFGTRRAHGVEAALYGARAAYIGGCVATSNVKAGKVFGIPIRGTHAHSWVESFDTEIDSFRGFSQVFPDNCVLLVDTYETLEGVRQAATVAKEMLRSGHRLQAIRIDSGDLAYWSKVARQVLDDAGLHEIKILASSDLDEYLIQSLRAQNAPIDVWCVGTRLMTSYQTPALGVVYKLMAIDWGDGRWIPRIKISENPQKVTNPGVKKIIRFHNGSGRMMGDILTGVDEPVPQGIPVRAHHPMYDYMKKTYRPPYTATELMVPVFLEGRQVYQPPPLHEIREKTIRQLDSLEPEYKRFSNPHIYKVSLSDQVFRTKKALLQYYEDKNRPEKKES